MGGGEREVTVIPARGHEYVIPARHEESCQRWKRGEHRGFGGLALGAERLELEHFEAALVLAFALRSGVSPCTRAASISYNVRGPQGEKGDHRGQGLFVARTYMAKMGGTVAVHNADDGVVFSLTLQRV